MYIETSANNSCDGNVFVSFERLDIIQIGKNFIEIDFQFSLLSVLSQVEDSKYSYYYQTDSGLQNI